jgi:hypothetical protein
VSGGAKSARQPGATVLVMPRRPGKQASTSPAGDERPLPETLLRRLRRLSDDQLAILELVAVGIERGLQ